MKRMLLSLFILLLVSFSGYSVLRTPQQPSNGGKPVPITPLAPKPCPTCAPRQSFTAYSGIGESLRMVIRDRDAWRDIWKEIHSPKGYGSGTELPPLPEIDFSREMVVVAALGARPSSGYSIIVDRAYERDDRLEIAVRTTSPGKGCMALAVVTAPVDVVRLPKTDRSVVFRETEITHNCK
jgi:hypothetical protein